jgi:hypothetical protein
MDEIVAVGPTPGLGMDSEVQRMVAEKMAVREHFIARYLDATGARIQDTELVEEMSMDRRQIVFWCRPRGSNVDS